jgi:hypothetical protein
VKTANDVVAKEYFVDPSNDQVVAKKGEKRVD